jgi:hypothetical protein
MQSRGDKSKKATPILEASSRPYIICAMVGMILSAGAIAFQPPGAVRNTLLAVCLILLGVMIGYLAVNIALPRILPKR